jgi:hypothetical protein
VRSAHRRLDGATAQALDDLLHAIVHHLVQGAAKCERLPLAASRDGRLLSGRESVCQHHQERVRPGPERAALRRALAPQAVHQRDGLAAQGAEQLSRHARASR